MIRLEVVKLEGPKDHWIIEADEPITVESVDGQVLVYRNQGLVEDSEPVGAYDPTVENRSWEV